MKSRNTLFATIRNLRQSRDNWRRKYEMLKEENKQLKEQMKYLSKPYPNTEAVRRLQKEMSKQYGWQAFRDKYL